MLLSAFVALDGSAFGIALIRAFVRLSRNRLID